MITNATYPGLQRFTYFINQVKTILDKANNTDDPALVIYQQNIRTPFFMLEALTRIYKKISNEKLFTKLNLKFKDIEDSLGAIDYYDGFYKEFTADKNIPQSVTNFVTKQKEISITDLNSKLTSGKWIGEKRKRVTKILQKLNEVEWLPESEDTDAIKKVYVESIDKLCSKFKNNEIQFNNIEADVHELRRALRWLSIYPQALRGLMQLKTDADTPEYLKKYLTPEIITSPYNVMPDGSGLQGHIVLEANNFYALSWMIAELGKLKDNGLRQILITDALKNTLNIPQQNAQELTSSTNAEAQKNISSILENAKEITTTFFKENILENLLAK